MSYKADVGDEWRTDCPPAGDCEDHSLCHIRRWLEAGESPSNLSLLVGQTSSGPHAVAVKGAEAFDNRRPYRWVVEGATHMQPLYTCRADGRAAVMVAGRWISSDMPEKCRAAFDEFKKEGLM